MYYYSVHAPQFRSKKDFGFDDSFQHKLLVRAHAFLHMKSCVACCDAVYRVMSYVVLYFVVCKSVKTTLW